MGLAAAMGCQSRRVCQGWICVPKPAESSTGESSRPDNSISIIIVINYYEVLIVCLVLYYCCYVCYHYYHYDYDYDYTG